MTDFLRPGHPVEKRKMRFSKRPCPTTTDSTSYFLCSASSALPVSMSLHCCCSSNSLELAAP